MGGAGGLRQVGNQADSIGNVDRLVSGGRVAVAVGQGRIQGRGNFAGFDHEFATVPGALRFQVIIQQHHIGATSRGQPAEVAVHAVAGGRVQRPHAPGGHGSNTGFHRLAHDPVETEEEEVIGIAVVGAHAHPLGAGSGPGDGLDGQRQGVPGRGRVAAAQKDPHAGLQKVGGDVRIDGLVGVGDAAGRAGAHEFPSVDVPADRLAALQGRREDGVAARVTHGHVHEVHLLAQRRGLGPTVEERADLLGGQVAPSGFELRTGGRHGAGDREEDVQRSSPGVFQHPLDPLGVAHIPDLMAVAENGGDAAEQGRLGIGAGRHHRRLDVDMRIDQAGGQDPAACIEEPGPGIFGA